MAIRWTCPEGVHPGQLGPKRPRKDAVVRYCLPCSIKAGRLVSRVAPAQESKRRPQQEAEQTRKLEAVEAAKQRKLEREREKAQALAKAPTRLNAPGDVSGDVAASPLEGLDWVHAEYARLCALPVFKSCAGSGTRPRKAAGRCKLGARLYRTPTLDAVTGCHHPHENRITVTVGPSASLARVSELLMHELCHAATKTGRTGGKKGGRRIYHGTAFKKTLCKAARQAYGLHVKPDAAKTAYGLDSVIVRQLKAAQPRMKRTLVKC